ncbi:MAG: NUDIX hydrolase [Pseudonocardiaceae bacterium]|nr:NUDIX hydrolase [Pseudonocardiaceae bacterium]
MVPPVPPDPPVTPRDAATVVLLRDSHRGPEVFLLRRAAAMAFAAGMTVFPGGGVDRADADADVAWTGNGPEWWAEVFNCDTGLARALVCAAVRETFEESGVLLAGPDPRTVVRDPTPYAGARAALVNRELSLGRFLAEAGLVLRADLLRPWANWLTPEVEHRRYDTRFMIAALPDGQSADGATSEAESAGWFRPQDALDDWKAGRTGLLPPTWRTLSELTEFDTVVEAMTAGRTLKKIIPKVLREGRKLRVVLPGDSRYDSAPTHLDARQDDEVE